MTRLLTRRAVLVAASLALAAFVLVSCSLNLQLGVLPLAAGVVALIGLGAGIRTWSLAVLASVAVTVTTFMLCNYVFSFGTPDVNEWMGFLQTVVFAGPPSALLGALGAVGAARAFRPAR